MTPAETPTECADLSFAYSDDKEIVALYLTIDGKTKLFVERGNEGPRIEALYARIRELEGLLRRYRVSGNSFRWIQKVKAIQAALARSEGGSK